ncbi:unnamed protein product [Protopolystoma xenopodis]|uniref:Uncharacterized protein n=1 Tax=Protopolystoma xenopodis TaxID=117903 RepID=A0A3S5B5F9_9PLAT|nr:unnamed protein product [Protopolystoma xenopodis]
MVVMPPPNIYALVTNSVRDDDETRTLETPLHYCASAGNSDILLEIVNHLHQDVWMTVNKQAKVSHSLLADLLSSARLCALYFA